MMLRRAIQARTYAKATTPNSVPNFQIFDRNSKLLQRSSAVRNSVKSSRKAEYIRDEIAIRTIERLSFIKRDLSKVLDFGSHSGNFIKNLCACSEAPKNGDEADFKMTEQLNDDKHMLRKRIKELVMFDSSGDVLNRDIDEGFNKSFEGKITRIIGDEETFDHEVLKENEYDAVISNLSLHWINDLPSVLKNINKILKPDGVFLGTIIGGDTLYELRTSLQLAEMERKGGVTPRMSPLVRLNDIGSLLSKAGFTMLTIDTEDIVIGGFPDIVTVCQELQNMGEQNSLSSRSNYLSRDVLLAANEIYKSLHGEKDLNGNTTLPATCSVISMIGWKISENQPRPLKRGTGEINFKDVL